MGLVFQMLPGDGPDLKMSNDSLHASRWLAVVAAFMLLLGTGCHHKEGAKMESELEMKKEIDVGIILDTTIPLKLAIPVTNRSDRIITISRVSKDCFPAQR